MRNLTILLLLIGQVAFSQSDLPINSNTYYSSVEDSSKMDPSKIAIQRIEIMDEYIKSKQYGDTLILMSRCYFRKDGLLTQVDSYDVYGKMSRTIYESDSDGLLSRIEFISSEGVRTSREVKLEYEQSKMKKVDGDDYEIKTTFDSLHRPIQMIEYLNAKEIQHASYEYNSSKTISEKIRDGVVVEIKTLKYSKTGLLIKYVVDKRNSIKHFSKRKIRAGSFHTIPLRYSKRTFKYDNHGNLVRMYYFGNPLMRSRKIKYTYDKDGRLIKESDSSKGKSKKVYQYEYSLYH